MYEIKKQKDEIDGVDLARNNSQIGKIITSFMLFMSISVGFGFLLGHFAFPKSCTNCSILQTELRTDGNAYIDFVSGTEYIANIGGLDTGQVIVRTVDYKGNPLNATCNATILNPDKTFYIITQPMYPSTINGNYYRTFAIPTISGVFEDYANCTVTLGSQQLQVSKASSFHVSPTLLFFQNLSNQIISVNQTVIDNANMLNNTIIWSHNDIIANLNFTVGDFNSTLTQILNEMGLYNNSLSIQISSLNSTILNAKTEILNSIKTARSDIEIIKEWISYMFGQVSGVQKGTGESWIDKIIGTKVTLPDWVIPRPQ